MDKDVEITMLAVVSADGFIADANGNGNFSSAEDKAALRTFLRSDACDCFICGRKTGEEFMDSLDYKPLFILTRSPKRTNDAADLGGLLTKIEEQGLSRPALLGGAEIYDLFLENDLVDKAIITRENGAVFGRGVAFDFGKLEKKLAPRGSRRLSEKTVQYLYERKRSR